MKNKNNINDIFFSIFRFLLVCSYCIVIISLNFERNVTKLFPRVAVYIKRNQFHTYHPPIIALSDAGGKNLLESTKLPHPFIQAYRKNEKERRQQEIEKIMHTSGIIDLHTLRYNKHI